MTAWKKAAEDRLSLIDSVILTVDDDPVMQESFRTMLEPAGAQVMNALSAPEALDQLSGLTPDLIITDLMMPVFDGREFCARLRADRRYDATPVIMVTSDRAPDGAIKALESGADEYITKPIRPAELRARAKSMIRLKRTYDEIQKLNKIREDLTLSLTHDLRHPLTCMRMQAEIMEQEHRDGAFTRNWPEELTQQIRKLDSMLDDLLRIAREAVHLQPESETETVALNRFLDDIASSDSAAKLSRRHTFRWTDSPVPIMAQINAKNFRRAVDNLLSNALKYSPSGGLIELSLSRTARDTALIQVSDEGVGITDSDKNSIFEKFTICDHGSNRFQQTGVGLHFCQTVATSHGGSIRARDNRPRGTILELEIPCKAAAPADIPDSGDA